MAECIEREAAYREFCTDDALSGYDKAYCCEIIKKIPAADVAPVVHGKWILVDTEKWIGVCSNCNRQDRIDHLATHCRFCGARMNDA